MNTQQGVDAPVSLEPMDDLLHAATTLHHSARQLNDSVLALEDALKKLNFGVPVWIHTSSTDRPPDQVNESEYLGYVKHKGTWGVCLRLDLEGLGPDTDEAVWRFVDAPRDMRMRGAEFLDRLVDEIKHEAEKTAVIVKDRAANVLKLAESVDAIADKARPKVNLRPKAGR